MTKKKTRVSGTMMKDGGGCAFVVRTQNAWEMDIAAVKKRLETYLDEAAESGRYSIAGLCIALGIPRSQLALWREGYVSAADFRDTAVLPNAKLSRCVEMALLHIQRYWEERDKPSSMDLKQLEATGALSENAPLAVLPPFDLGRLKKYAR